MLSFIIAFMMSTAYEPGVVPATIDEVAPLHVMLFKTFDSTGTIIRGGNGEAIYIEIQGKPTKEMLETAKGYLDGYQE